LTTIVAVEDRGRVHLGSDSQATLGSSKMAIAGGKIISKDGYTFGLAGVAEMLTRLKRTDWPQVSGDLDTFVADELLPFLLETQSTMFRDFGIDENSDNPFNQPPISAILLAVQGRVFELELVKGLSPLRREDGRYTIGSGSKYARGALGAARKNDRRTVLAALEAASKNDIYTSAPFVVKTVR
jgi:ATP-dependent protease HslVU (ClpYQ) peptidase subunit